MADSIDRYKINLKVPVFKIPAAVTLAPVGKKNMSDTVNLAPAHDERRVPSLVVDCPCSGPSLLACAPSTQSGRNPDADEFFFLEYDEVDDVTYVCLAKDEYVTGYLHGPESVRTASDAVPHWIHERLYRLPARSCNRKTTQLVLNSSATLLAVLSPHHLVVLDISYHTTAGADGGVMTSTSAKRRITLVKRSHLSDCLLISCSWHPTQGDVLVVLDGSSVSMYYFWDAAVNAQLSSVFSSSASSSSASELSPEGHSFWCDVLVLPFSSVTSFCFGNQEPLEDAMEDSDDVSWEPFTLYVLCNNGNISAGCPVVPRGLTMSDEKLHRMQEATERSRWTELNWARCLKGGEFLKEWQYLNFQGARHGGGGGVTWYHASHNDRESRGSLSATSLVSLRGVDDKYGYPFLMTSWSNGEIDLTLVYEPTDGRKSSEVEMDEIHCQRILRMNSFLHVPPSLSPSRVGLLLDDLDNTIIYVIGRYEIIRLSLDDEALEETLQNSSEHTQNAQRKIFVSSHMYYVQPASEGVSQQQVEGVVLHTLRPDDYRLRVLTSSGSVLQLDVGHKVMEQETRERLTERRGRRGGSLLLDQGNRREDDIGAVVDEESLGAHSIQWAMEKAQKKMNQPLPNLSWNINTKMDKIKGLDLAHFLEAVKDKRIVPLQEYEKALRVQKKTWEKLWEAMQKRLENLKHKKVLYSDKLSKVTKKLIKLKEKTTENKKKIAQYTDLILRHQNHIREEEHDWFRELETRKNELELFQHKYKDWLIDSHMVEKEEVVIEVEAHCDCVNTKTLTVTRLVPSKWSRDEESMAPVQYVVQWPGCPHGEEPLIVRYFREEEKMGTKIKLNMKVASLLKGTKLTIIRRVVDFTPDKAESIEAERKRVRKEEERARRHNRGGRRRMERSETKQEKQEDDLDEVTRKKFKDELKKVKKELDELKYDLEKMDDESLFRRK